MKSPSSDQFERWTSSFGLFLGPALFTISLLAPPLTGVTAVGMRTLGIFLWVVVWWVFEPVPLPVSGLLSLALLVLCGVYPLQTAFNFWANRINIFLIGVFIIARAMENHGLTQRFAYQMLAFRSIAGHPWRFLIVFLSAAALLSGVISPLTTTAIFVPIGIGLLEALQVKQGSRFGMVMIMCIAWAAAIGSIATPIGALNNLVAVGLIEESLHYRVSFLRWMMAGIPLMLVELAALFLFIRVLVAPEIKELEFSSKFVEEQLRKLGPISWAEKVAATAFILAMGLWIFPDVAPLLWGKQHPVTIWVEQYLSTAIVSILVSTALFLIPVNFKQRKYVITWPEASKGVPWGILALIAAILSLSGTIASPDKGVGTFLTQTLQSTLGSGAPPYFVVLISVLAVAALSNFASHAASVSIIGTVMLTVFSSFSLPINPVALLFTINAGSTTAFTLPSGTPANAVVLSSDYVRKVDMLTYGAVLLFIEVLIGWLLGYTLARTALPWPVS